VRACGWRFWTSRPFPSSVETYFGSRVGIGVPVHAIKCAAAGTEVGRSVVPGINQPHRARTTEELSFWAGVHRPPCECDAMLVLSSSW
jgi:hypothetical protein